MKKVNITAEVTYTVLFSAEVSDELYDQLDEFLTLGRVDNYRSMVNDVDSAFEFLVENCREDDALDYEIEITDLEDE